MKHFLWIVKIAQEALLESIAGILPTYTPPDPGDAIARDLSDAILFVVVRGPDVDVLLKKIFVRSAVALSDEEAGMPSGRLEIRTDLLRSVGLAENFRSGKDVFTVGFTRDFDEGLHAISPKKASVLRRMMTKNFAQKFSPFPSWLLVKIGKNAKAPVAEARHLIREIVKRIPQNRIWGNVRTRKNPFLNFAMACAEQSGLSEEAQSALPMLCEDLFRIEFEKEVAVPVVDTELVRIVPENIRARKFLAGDNDRDLFAAVEKTSDAELRHQKILADVCEFFCGRGWEPQQSSSVDLAIRVDGVLNIFEIKTADPKNVFSQAAKGAFQLARYSCGFRAEGETIGRKILVLEENIPQRMRESLFAFVRELGEEVLFYSEERSWPDRLSPPIGHM